MADGPENKPIYEVLPAQDFKLWNNFVPDCTTTSIIIIYSK